MDIIGENLKKLLSKEWDGKAVWESIRDGELTAASSFKGELYDKATTKIMYVGHAVNGWGELDISKCITLEKTVEAILNQEGALDTFVNDSGYPYIKKNGTQGVYYHINYNFLRLIKHILEFQGESDSPTTRESWYNDSREWNKKFVWSNLYCIAPACGGNPTDKFIKMGMEQYTEMIKAQIEKYKPDVVIFCPLKGYFIPWEKERSFDEILDLYQSFDDKGPIIGKGKLGATHIIVCKRPDARGNSREDVLEMAKIISDYINDICKRK